MPADWRAAQIERLTFRHDTSRGPRPTLDAITLPLKRGARIALVGESGAGKSTLLRILAGQYDADAGRLVVDGVERASIAELGGVSLLIPQDGEIFENTVEYNLTMGIARDPAWVRRACDVARFTPVLEGLPQGLATTISERGTNLSGGQKQRLALARGLVAAQGASLLLLDEPTSHMDPETESQVYDALFAHAGDACVLSSIHRLHLLSRFDVVVLLAEGRVVDSGTRDELLARQPRFRAAWERTQKSAAPPTVRYGPEVTSGMPSMPVSTST